MPRALIASRAAGGRTPNVKLLIPVNSRTGKNIGVVAQIRFYLDDIAPQIFTWTPFSGVLGSAQPR